MDDHPDLVRLRSRSPSRPADVVAHVLDPLVVVAGTLVVVAVVASGPTGLVWAAAALVFAVGIPEVALRLHMRARGIADRHLVVRESRHVPVAAAAVSVCVGVVVLLIAGAPAAISAYVVTVLAGVVAMGVLTRVWKASFHTAVVASAAVVLGLVLGPVAVAPAVGAVALVGWARVRAGRHSLAQVVVGGLVGAASAAAVFPAMT